MKVLCLIFLIADIFLFGGAGYRVLTVSASEVEVARHRMAVNAEAAGGSSVNFGNFSMPGGSSSASVEDTEVGDPSVTFSTENGRTTYDIDMDTATDESADQEIKQEGFDDATAKIRGIGKK